MNLEKLRYLRTFLPSWRFFDRVGITLTIQIRGKDCNDWIALFDNENERRSLFNLFHNPIGNYQFAANSLIEQWHQDPQSKVMTEYLDSLVRFQAKSRIPEPYSKIEFRVFEHDQGLEDLSKGKLILTREIEG